MVELCGDLMEELVHRYPVRGREREGEGGSEESRIME